MRGGRQSTNESHTCEASMAHPHQSPMEVCLGHPAIVYNDETLALEPRNK